MYLLASASNMLFCSSRSLRLCFVVATFGFFVVVPALATDQAFRHTGSSTRGREFGRPLTPDKYTSSTATNSRPILHDHGYGCHDGDSNISISNDGSEGGWEESRWHDDVKSQCDQSSNHMLQHSFARDAGGIRQIRSDIFRGVIVIDSIRVLISVLSGNWGGDDRSLAYNFGRCIARFLWTVLRFTYYMIALELGRLLFPTCTAREGEKQNKHMLTPSLSGIREVRSSIVRGVLVINAVRYLSIFAAISGDLRHAINASRSLSSFDEGEFFGRQLGKYIRETAITTLFAMLSLEVGYHCRDNKLSYNAE